MPNSADAALPVPKHWTRSIQAALLHVIALAKYALVYTRSWAGNSASQRVRLAAKANQLEQQIGLQIVKEQMPHPWLPETGTAASFASQK